MVRRCRSEGPGSARPTKSERRLGSYELFQRSGPMQASVWDKIVRGLSTRNYGAVVKDFHDAYGIEKSAVSENFIEASREKVKELMERPLGELRLRAVLIDGTPFKDRQMIVALVWRRHGISNGYYWESSGRRINARRTRPVV